MKYISIKEKKLSQLFSVVPLQLIPENRLEFSARRCTTPLTMFGWLKHLRRCFLLSSSELIKDLKKIRNSDK